MTEPETVCPVPDCEWQPVPPPLKLPLPRGMTLEQIIQTVVGTEEELFESFINHLVDHGPEGATALLRAAKGMGVLDDPDLFVMATAEGEAAMARLGLNERRGELERWLRGGVAGMEME